MSHRGKCYDCESEAELTSSTGGPYQFDLDSLCAPCLARRRLTAAYGAPTCADCRFSTPRDPVEGFLDCSKFSGDDGAHDDDQRKVLAFSDIHASLIVDPSFGCKLWRQKP